MLFRSQIRDIEKLVNEFSNFARMPRPILKKINFLKLINKSLDFVKSNGIEDDLLQFEGLSPQMLEALIKDGIKSLKDFATCADWELAGGYTTVDGKRVRDEGLLEQFELSISEAQQLIMKAREMLGWVTKEESEEIIRSLDK